MPVLAVAVLIAMAAFAGCGSSSGVSPAAYVHALCGAIYPWEQDVVSNSVKLQAGLALVKTPAQAKLLLQAYVTTVSTDTDTAVTRLRAAGTPRVKNGTAISHRIVAVFSQVASAYHQALAQVNGLPTASTSAYGAGLERLHTLLSSVGNISQQLKAGPLTSPELHKAAAREPACHAQTA
jgi:hypothetical protein